MSNLESKIYNIIIIVLLIAIAVAGVILYQKKRPPKIQGQEIYESYTITLVGSKTINLYVGDTYKEPGYSARDQDGKDVSSRVTITGSVDTKKEGTYELKYSIESANAYAFETRNIIVNKKSTTPTPTPTPTKVTIDFHLLGNSTVQVKQNATYNEPGFVAVDSNKKDLKSYVKTSGSVNTSKVGSYTITYTLNYDGQTKTLKRKVNVISESTSETNKFSVKLSTTALTNDNVIITVQALSDDFAYFINPNNSKITDKTTLYYVGYNGTFNFKIYNTSGVGKEFQVVVDNIDKTPPAGSCTATIINNQYTRYEVIAYDENGVYRFEHNGQIFQSTFTISAVEYNGVVTAYDKVGNSTTITCKMG